MGGIADEAFLDPPEAALAHVAGRPGLGRHLALAIQHDAAPEHRGALQDGDELGGDLVGEAGLLGAGRGQRDHRLQRHLAAAAIEVEDAVAAGVQRGGGVDLLEGLAHGPQHQRLGRIEGQAAGAEAEPHGRPDPRRRLRRSLEPRLAERPDLAVASQRLQGAAVGHPGGDEAGMRRAQPLQDLGRRLGPALGQALDRGQKLPPVPWAQPLGGVVGQAGDGPLVGPKQLLRGPARRPDGLLQPLLGLAEDAHRQEQLAAVLVEAPRRLARREAGVHHPDGAGNVAQAMHQPRRRDRGLRLSGIGAHRRQSRLEVLVGQPQVLQDHRAAVAAGAAEAGLRVPTASNHAQMLLVHGGILQRERHPSPCRSGVRPPRSRPLASIGPGGIRFQARYPPDSPAELAHRRARTLKLRPG